MKGNNLIQLNEASLIEAVQHYFNNIMFKPNQAPTITAISEDKGMNGNFFLIRTKEEEEE